MSHPRLLPVSLALVGLSVVSGSAGAEPATLVILVRHAEKETGGGADPSLSPRGQERAEALREVLSGVPIDLVITSEFRRTGETAGPLTRDRELEPVVIGAGGGLRGHLEGIVEAIRAKPGGSILVVGHANTVPLIVKALGGPAVEDLDESTYDALFTLVLEPGGTPRLVRSRYGAASGD